MGQRHQSDLNPFAAGEKRKEKKRQKTAAQAVVMIDLGQLGTIRGRITGSNLFEEAAGALWTRPGDKHSLIYPGSLCHSHGAQVERNREKCH